MSYRFFGEAMSLPLGLLILACIVFVIIGVMEKMPSATQNHTTPQRHAAYRTPLNVESSQNKHLEDPNVVSDEDFREAMQQLSDVFKKKDDAGSN